MKEIITLYIWATAIYNRKRFQGITSEVVSLLPAKHIAGNTIKLHNNFERDCLQRFRRHLCLGPEPGRFRDGCPALPQGPAAPQRASEGLKMEHHQGKLIADSSCLDQKYKVLNIRYFTFLWCVLSAVLMDILHCYGQPNKKLLLFSSKSLPGLLFKLKFSSLTMLRIFIPPIPYQSKFQQGYLPTKSSSHAKCISQKSDNAAHKPHKTYIYSRFNFISVFEGTWSKIRSDILVICKWQLNICIICQGRKMQINFGKVCNFFVILSYS